MAGIGTHPGKRHGKPRVVLPTGVGERLHRTLDLPGLDALAGELALEFFLRMLAAAQQANGTLRRGQLGPAFATGRRRGLYAPGRPEQRLGCPSSRVARFQNLKFGRACDCAGAGAFRIGCKAPTTDRANVSTLDSRACESRQAFNLLRASVPMAKATTGSLRSEPLAVRQGTSRRNILVAVHGEAGLLRLSCGLFARCFNLDQLLADARFQLARHLGIFLEEVPGIFLALSDALAVVAVPGT